MYIHILYPFSEILFGVLTFFELLKLKVRIDKWKSQKSKHIFITESNTMEKVELEEEEKAEQFENEWNLDQLTSHINGKSVEDLKQQLQEQLNKMRKGDKIKFNLGYQDIMLKSNKKMGIITTLPIPEIFKKPRLGKYSYRNIKVWIFSKVI